MPYYHLHVNTIFGSKSYELWWPFFKNTNCQHWLLDLSLGFGLPPKYCVVVKRTWLITVFFNANNCLANAEQKFTAPAVLSTYPIRHTERESRTGDKSRKALISESRLLCGLFPPELSTVFLTKRNIQFLTVPQFKIHYANHGNFVHSKRRVRKRLIPGRISGKAGTNGIILMEL